MAYQMTDDDRAMLKLLNLAKLFVKNGRRFILNTKFNFSPYPDKHVLTVDHPDYTAINISYDRKSGYKVDRAFPILDELDETDMEFDIPVIRGFDAKEIANALEFFLIEEEEAKKKRLLVGEQPT